VDEISFLVRGTRYNEVVREGIHHFRTGRESFMLEAFLDKTFHENLVLTREQEPGLPSIAKAYLAMQVELYNLQVVSRGIMAGLPTNLMLQLLVPTAYLVGNETLELMIENGTIKGALSLLEGALAKFDVKLGAKTPGKEKSEFVERINHLYMEHFMKKYKPIHDDFRYMAFYETIHTIIKKTDEIYNYINPALTRVLHANILFKRE
ncbi:hypothetical protein GF325_01300, partial [Candidatus Bathyarchaeota archaeon]|nr:hypothetical protein [Candidatus Bathyarchaeota archaeon]